MNQIEEFTELFDLFGETGTCVICQEELQDGDRVRCLRTCQHLFHSQCIDPWLLKQFNCPLCRKAIHGMDANVTGPATNHNAILMNIQRMIDMLQNRISTVNQVVQAQDVQTDLQRYQLSYVLAKGIQNKFPRAYNFNAHRDALRTFLAGFQLNGIRPVPIDIHSHASLTRSVQIRSELIRRMNWNGYLAHFRVRSIPALRQFRERLEEGFATELQPFWIAP
jgi:Ring finger domain